MAACRPCRQQRDADVHKTSEVLLGNSVVGHFSNSFRGKNNVVGKKFRHWGLGGWHNASVSDCLPLAAPISLSPLLILTLCGPERVLVVSTEPPDDLSCLTTPGVGRPGDGVLPVPLMDIRGGGGGAGYVNYFDGEYFVGDGKIPPPLDIPKLSTASHTPSRASPCSVQSQKDLHINLPLKSASVHKICKNLLLQTIEAVPRTP